MVEALEVKAISWLEFIENVASEKNESTIKRNLKIQDPSKYKQWKIEKRVMVRCTAVPRTTTLLKNVMAESTASRTTSFVARLYD
jgi:hypothetical protein